MNLGVLNSLIVGRVNPSIYAFSTNQIPQYLKVGDTFRPLSVRLDEWKKHFPDLTLQFQHTASIDDTVFFRDYAVHKYLETDSKKERLQRCNIPSTTYYSNEFFKNTLPVDVEHAIADIQAQHNHSAKYQYYDAVNALPATYHYAKTGVWKPRPNQEDAIQNFVKAVDNGRTNLLMYAVMRFGKSFTSLCCAAAKDYKLVVVVSAKADVEKEWKPTVESAENFEHYQFLNGKTLGESDHVIADILASTGKQNRAVVFLTLQDLMGSQMKSKHKELFDSKLDLLIVDETHFGARADKFGMVLNPQDSDPEEDDDVVDFSAATVQLKTFRPKVRLHLSGTPYRILMGSEFQKEDIISFCQFTDIAAEQQKWDEDNLLNDDVKEWDNPYYGFPQMIRFAFHPNESALKKMNELKADGISLSFSALFKPKSVQKSSNNLHKKFVNEQEILELLQSIDGSRTDANLFSFLNYDKIKDGNMCRHMVMVLPYCASCDAMEALLQKHRNTFHNLRDYAVLNISGVERNKAYQSVEDVKSAIENFENNKRKTLTLTVNRMLTGSTVKQWDTMLYCKDTASPQEYDQAIFRLQNQYIRSYKHAHNEVIKFNMKPQTLLVDFNPNRMFFMQEQKSMIYNVNTDAAGNSKLKDRLDQELQVSPIIVLNADKMQQVTSTDILQAVSAYAKNKDVMDETVEIPVDMDLFQYKSISNAIQQESEFGSKDGLSTTAHESDADGSDLNTGSIDGQVAKQGDPSPANTNGATNTNPDENKKDPIKQFRNYYARILFFAYLTKDTVYSLSNILDCAERGENIRILHNLGINYEVLSAMQQHMNKFVLSALDYKIQIMNTRSHDDSLTELEKCTVSIQKFKKIGESEVTTPQNICAEMVASISDQTYVNTLQNGGKILDVAGKLGDFAIALYEKYTQLGYDSTAIKDVIYTIPTSSITYEFTRKIYEALGLNVENIASQFNTYDLLNIKNDDGTAVDCERIRNLLTQNKDFSHIKLDDDLQKGDTHVKFDAVVGNPPYQESAAKTSDRPIYHLFMDIAFNLAEKVSFITPARFLFNAGKTPKGWNNERLNDTHFKVVSYYPKSGDVFENADIRGGVAITFRDTQADFGKIGIFSSYGELNSIKDKVCATTFTPLSEVVFSPESYKLSKELHAKNPWAKDRLSKGHLSDITTNIFEKLPELFLDDKPSDAYIGIYGRQQNARVTKWIERQYVANHENLDFYKVFVPKSNGSGAIGEVLSTPVVGQLNIGHTQTFISMGKFTTEYEANALLKYIKTKFARCMLSILKVTQDNKQAVWKLIPQQDFTQDATEIDWSKSIAEIDQQLYQKYDLDQGEIQFIESMVRPMD